MRNLRNRTASLAMTFFIAVILLTSCKVKKPVAAEPAPTTQASPPSEQTTAIETPAETDTDKDGVIDTKDNCPNKAGSSLNNGCPEAPKPAETVKAEPTFNYKNILFEFNSSVLKTSSYPILDEIAREMKKYPGMSFALNGHSSAEGSVERNMTLSVDRGTAVKAYLVGLGISSASLEVKGFGESMPITSNDSEAGRQLNRRVEIRRTGV